MERDLIVADQFRDGNVPAGQDPLSLAKAAFAVLPESVTEFAYRADSASYQHELLNWLRGENKWDHPRCPVTFAISYDSDKYGRTTGNTPRERAWNYKGWKRIAAARKNDETIFKYAVNLLEGIDHIKTGSPAERKKILAIFRKHGITRLPDGRKVEEIVK